MSSSRLASYLCCAYDNRHREMSLCWNLSRQNVGAWTSAIDYNVEKRNGGVASMASSSHPLPTLPRLASSSCLCSLMDWWWAVMGRRKSGEKRERRSERSEREREIHTALTSLMQCVFMMTVNSADREKNLTWRTNMWNISHQHIFFI